MNFCTYIVIMVFLCHLNNAKGEYCLGGIINELIEYPVIQQVMQGCGKILAGIINIILSIPLTIASMIGGYHIPTIKNKNNMVEVFDNFVATYIIALSNEDAKLSIADLILKYGFPLEIHNVETTDGYVLTMHRIPNNGSAVFLMHGLLGSADDFIVAGPESGLAYLLAREGYDVWMGNARGNKHSRSHKNLHPSQKEFWDFSWHEIGIFDLPAMLDYILEVTNSKQLKYIGHSQGTTVFFVMASERPEYNDKISVMVALSPVAFMSHIKSPLIKLLVPFSPFVESALQTVGAYELLPDNFLIRKLKKAVCEIGAVYELLCTNVAFLLVGFDFVQLNVTNLRVIFEHMPSGGSINQLVHFGQGIISSEFAKFDYGSENNEKVYGANVPPKYQLDRISTPVALFYSDNDWLAHPTDVGKLSMKLSNVIEVYRVPNENFNHLDFILAKDLKILIYDKLQYILKQF